MASTIQVDKIQDTGGNTIVSSNSTGTFTNNLPANLTGATGTLAIAQGGTGAATLAAAGLANTPAFSVRDTTQQSVTDNTDTKVTWNTELLDSDSAFASDKFTVPSGEGGYYYIYAIACLDSQGSSNLNVAYLNIFVNGSRVTMSENDFRSNPLRKYNATVTTIQSLSASDYVEVYAKIDTSDAGAGLVTGDDYQQMFGGYKLIGA
jgi:hypothetical protein